ncbi:hypothetical protein JCM8547_000456 [Rhodosporidiobolus lusitaniae]
MAAPLQSRTFKASKANFSFQMSVMTKWSQHFVALELDTADKNLLGTAIAAVAFSPRVVKLVLHEMAL